MNIEIGNRKLKDITQDELIEMCLIEGVHAFLDYWSKPIVTDFDNKMFSDTICIDYHSLRLEDKFKSMTIMFYFNYTDFRYHWHREGQEHNTRKRLKIESIKYLLSKGFDLPIY